MTTFTIQAVYKSGVLQPKTKLDLPDDTQVQVQVTPLTAGTPLVGSLFGSLRGILSNLNDMEVNDIESDRAAIRQQTRDRIERLVRDL